MGVHQPGARFHLQHCRNIRGFNHESLNIWGKIWVCPKIWYPKVWRFIIILTLKAIPKVSRQTISIHSPILLVIPSGKRLHNYGKSPFLMGKSTISITMFNSFLFVYQWVYSINFHQFPMNFPAACHELIEHGRPLLVEKFEDRSHCSIVLIVFVKHPIAIYISFYTSYIYIY